jgi:hypothetical protein
MSLVSMVVRGGYGAQPVFATRESLSWDYLGITLRLS